MDIEQEDAIGSPGKVSAGGDIDFPMKITLGVLALISTAFATLLAWALKRRSKENNAEDWAWSANQTTIQRLEKELAAERTENDTVRTERNKFDAACTRAHAELEIAQNAARAASEALSRTTSDIEMLRHSWEKAQRYIHILRMALAKNNLEIPAEPTS